MRKITARILTTACTGVLSASGILFSSRLLLDHRRLQLGQGAPLAFCDGHATGGCRATALSVFAEVYPRVPVAALAIGFFAASLIATILAMRKNAESRRVDDRIWFAIQGYATLVSLFYLSIMTLQLKVLCAGCATVHALNALLFAVRYFAWRESRRAASSWQVREVLPVISGIGIACAAAVFTYQFTTPPLVREYSFVSENPSAPADERYTLTLGSTGPLIPLTMAIDPVCPYCKEHLMNLSEAVVAAGKRVQIRVLLFPLDKDCNPAWSTKYPGSCSATRIAVCRAKRGEFGDFVRQTLAHPGQLLENLDASLLLAEPRSEARASLAECAHSKTTTTEIENQLALAESTDATVGVDAVPTTWIHGKRIQGRLRAAEWARVLRDID